MLQEVTKVQAAERAAARHLQNQHTLDRYIVASSPRGAASSRSTAGKLHPVLCVLVATAALPALLYTSRGQRQIAQHHALKAPWQHLAFIDVNM